MTDPNTSAYTQMMFGQYAKHLPAWLFVQQAPGNSISFVGASRSNDLRFNGQKRIQLLLGEIIFRPHWVGESNIFVGHGLDGLATANKEEFINADDLNVLCNPLKLDSPYFQTDAR